MKIGIIGATNNVGQVIYREALSRGHEVTAVVRNRDKATEMFGRDTEMVVKDAMDLTADDLVVFDVVVDATSPQPGYLNLDLLTKLVSFFREKKAPRLIAIVDSSSLIDDQGEMQLAAVLKQYADAPWIQASSQQVHELQFLQWVDNVDWTVMTPQNEFVAGDKHPYRLGTDGVMTNPDGKSTVTFSTFASAMLDEIETPAHKHQRITVVDD